MSEPAFTAHLTKQGWELPGYVQREFEDCLRCGRLEHGFLRVRCKSCRAGHLVAFSCKQRGFCPSCGARRMADNAALLVDEVLSRQRLRQRVLSFPFPLRFLFASRPQIMGRVLGIVYRVIATRNTRGQACINSALTIISTASPSRNRVSNVWSWMSISQGMVSRPASPLAD